MGRLARVIFDLIKHLPDEFSHSFKVLLNTTWCSFYFVIMGQTPVAHHIRHTEMDV